MAGGYICLKTTAMSSIVQQHFIEQVLTQEGDRYLKNQEAAMEALLNFHTRNIVDRRDVRTETSADLSGKLTISHTAYERFLDMKALQYGNRVVRQNRKIHNRYVWGTYNSIAYRLLNDFTDKVAAGIKAKLNIK